MRTSLALVALLAALGACSGGGSEQQHGSGSGAPSISNDASADASGASASVEEGAAAGPQISPTAAPRVAFNYRYAFRLAAERVSEVQEQHAARCEQLGPDRCRIVGMLYRRHDDENIEARLSFKLHPAIARIFGREGVGTVTRAGGMLVESEITGTDVGTAIRQAGKSIAELREDLARIEARLRGRIGSGERQSLEYEAQQLRSSIRAAEQNRAEAQETLATTPMTFAYGSGSHVPGPQPRRSAAEIVEDAWEGFVAGVAILFVIVVTLLPWALLALLVWLVVRWVRRRWFRAESAAPGGFAPEPPDAG